MTVKLPKCLLVFEQAEFYEMLKARPDIWRAAIKRGKYRLRFGKEQNRKVNPQKECD
ncbi:hypothetical protein [Sporolituus thermophilus]|uniref:hypothetical protein n=1 Tax=Sporolituus thermophilus TaxID=608505 RepID=UPI00149589A0|nr:hypothetical protein [Sporolituus thermophilus]